MQNNFNDIFQKMQSMQQMNGGGQMENQGFNNQALLQSLLANNPQLQQYQAMMKMNNPSGVPFSPQFNNNNGAQQPSGQNPNATAQSQDGNASQVNFNQNSNSIPNQNFNAAMPNFQNMPNGVDPMTLMNMMNNMQRQNAQTAPARAGAVRRKSFGLSPIVGFANRDIIYALTKYFAKK